ncbi:hypothetical protein GJ496_007682 [Pomphorhynchus laevis]|nr:hypothetical protein GJ496_007682 [Pomphorhynchus laevis]
MIQDLSDSDSDLVGVDDPAYRRRIVDVSPAEDLHATSCVHVSDRIDVDDTLDCRSVTAPDADWLGYSIGANQIIQTIAKCRSSRSYLDYNECISQLRQDVPIQIAKCISMVLRMRTKAEQILFSNDNNIWPSE